MIRLVDSHCHLDMLEPEARAEAISRAVRSGVRGMLTIATRLSAAEDVIAMAADHSPHVMAAVGVHPHRVGENGVPAEAELVAWGSRPDVAGLGETGLDYFYDNSPRDQQQESFRRHIRASNETGTPVYRPHPQCRRRYDYHPEGRSIGRGAQGGPPLLLIRP